MNDDFERIKGKANIFDFWRFIVLRILYLKPLDNVILFLFKSSILIPVGPGFNE